MMVKFDGLKGFEWVLDRRDRDELTSLKFELLDTVRHLAVAYAYEIAVTTGTNVEFNWNTFDLKLTCGKHVEYVLYDNDKWQAKDLDPSSFVASVDFLCWLTSNMILRRGECPVLILSLDHERFFKRQFDQLRASRLMRVRREALSGSGKLAPLMEETLEVMAGLYGLRAKLFWDGVSIQMSKRSEVAFYTRTNTWLGDGLSQAQAHFVQTYLCWLSAIIL